MRKIASIVLLTLAGCANGNYNYIVDPYTSKAPMSEYESTKSYCVGKANEVQSNAAGGVVLGALLGAMIGAPFNSMGSGALIGGLSGAAGAADADSTRQQTIYINCMRSRGFNILG